MTKVQIEIEAEELWSALWGSSYELDPVSRTWLMNVEFLEGAQWDKSGTARIWFIPENGDDENPKYWGKQYQKHCLNKDITVDVIAEVLGSAMVEKYGHCGEPIGADIDNWDSCVTDLLLQLVAYGKEVWA